MRKHKSEAIAETPQEIIKRRRKAAEPLQAQKSSLKKEKPCKPYDLIAQFLPEYAKLKLTREEAHYAIFYILNGRDGKQAYSQAYKIPLNEIQRGTEAYYNNLCLNSDPRIKEAADLILDRFFLCKKDDLKQRLLEVLQEQAFFDPAEIINSNGELKTDLDNLPLSLRRIVHGIKSGKDGVKVELADRMEAVKILGDYAGIASPIKSELTLNLTKDEEKELAEMFIKGMQDNGKRKL
jgi:hypothetical protein